MAVLKIPGLESLTPKQQQAFGSWLRQTINQQIETEKDRIYTPTEIANLIPYQMKGQGRAPNDLVPSVGLSHNVAMAITNVTLTTLGTTAPTGACFATKMWDNDSMWTSTAPGTITVKRAGIYLFSSYMEWAGSAVGERYHEHTFVRVDGNMTPSDRRNPSATNTLAESTVNSVLSMRKGDTAKILVYQSSGGNLNLYRAVSPLLFSATKIANITGGD